MEFLVKSDANLSARLDTLASTVARQQAEISDLGSLVAETREDVRGIHVGMHDMRVEMHDMRVETRDAIIRMIEIAEGIAATATTFAERSTDHESRIRRLERQLPSDAA
jgi:uncharacterized coiled-coil protein SlyX